MEEYYKIRYNLYKYFFNVDNENYDFILTTLFYIILCVLMCLACFFIVVIDTVDLYLITFVIFFIVYLYLSYCLLRTLSDIDKDENLNVYKTYYDLCNVIYRENGIIDINIVPNIKNIEKIFDPSELNIFINNNITNNDILKYTDLNNFDNTKLYFDPKTMLDLFISNNYIASDTNKSYIKLDVLFNDVSYNNPLKDSQQVVLNYINRKYKKHYTTLYIPKNSLEINKYDNYISKIRQNSYLFILLSVYFLVIGFHGLFLRYDYYLISTYLIIILLLGGLSAGYYYILMYYK
jgi:Ca2+/Na+ antiporter